MKLHELYDQQTVTFRYGHYIEHKDAPAWSEWTRGVINVQRNAKGEIVTLSINGLDWAEYSEYELYDDGVFEAEGYYLQIQGLFP